jgi:SAM-dependent methyltransferase
MTSLLQRALEFGPLRRTARQASDWVDLQWSLVISELRAVAPRARGRLLDVGCGEKPYESIFRPYVTEYIGVEYARTFEDTASSSRKTGPDFYYDGKVLPFESQSFDTVISIQVLEHTPHPQVVLDEMARVVRKDGIVIVSVPFSFRLHEEPHDYFRYTPHGLRAMFEAAGLTVDEVRGQGDLWSVLGHKLNSYLAFRVAHLGAIGQAMGKLGHEATGKPERLRVWALPLVLPTMAMVSAASRVLDRVAPDGTETLSYLAIGRPRA